MFKESIFFVVGLDFNGRKRAIDNIKAKLLTKGISSFNIHIYYSKEIDLNKLMSLVFSVPMGEKRVIVFKNAHELRKDVKELFINRIKEIVRYNYLIFDIEKDASALREDRLFVNDKFFRYFVGRSTLLRISSFTPDISIRKLTYSIRKHSLEDSLYTLENIFSNTNKNKDIVGMQIMGAITRSFSYVNSPLEKRRCFELIGETERLLKERRVDSKTALELLITKLILR